MLPKHYWEGTDEQGRKRDISQTTLEKPLGSGPYRIKEFVAGRSVTLERVKDYWGVKLRMRVGQNNFDEMRFEFFRDNHVALEAFKADQADWIAENSAKQWATAYEFPAVVDKRVVEEFPINDSGRMQTFAINNRREQFRDPRVRRAFNYAYDFEEMNKQLFYGQYKRINSYFEGTELASRACRRARSWRCWSRCVARSRRKSSPRLTPIRLAAIPKTSATICAKRCRLLKEAGFEVKERKLVDTTGKPVTVEILVQDPRPSASRCSTSLRWSASASPHRSASSIDAQYQNRIRSFDFDMIIDQWGQSLSPGNEQREFWGSPAADSRVRATPSASRIRRSTR